MKRTNLSPRDAAFLAETFARNRARFAGWSMEADDDAEKGSGKDGDDAKKGADADKGNAGSDDKGYPENTRVEDMKPEQQAAYYRTQARKHEERNRDILKRTGGKYGDDLQAELDELNRLRTERLTDGEKALEDAKRTAREEAQREYGPKMARLAFETALAHRDDRSDLIDALNLTSVLTDSGDVDTDKVRTIVERIAPADKGTGGQRHDFGGGRREQKPQGGSIAQIMADRRAARSAQQ